MVKKTVLETSKPCYLACISDTDYSQRALRFAAAMARRMEGVLMVLHVTEPSDYKSFGIIEGTMQAERKMEAEALLKAMTKNMKVEKHLLYRNGFIEEEIIQVIEENPNIHMLVLGAAAHTSAKNKVLQPLVAQLGHRIAIPMLIVPGNISEQQIEILE